MANKKNDELVTWTGVPASEIPDKLAETFPLEAFKALKGSSKGLSDINTGWMIQRITEVLGPKGLGWNLQYDPSDMLIYGDPQPTHQFNQLLAWLRNAKFVYYLFEVDSDKSAPALRVEIQTSGTSVNDQPYAEEGARTNATGAAVKWLLFQNELYKGNLDAMIDPAPQPRKNKDTTTKPKRGNKPPAPATKQPATPKPATLLERALAYTVPEGLPYAGKPIKELMEKETVAVGVLSYLAGKSANPQGDLFEPKTEEDEKLQAAAVFILEQKFNGNKK